MNLCIVLTTDHVFEVMLYVQGSDLFDAPETSKHNFVYEFVFSKFCACKLWLSWRILYEFCDDWSVIFLCLQLFSDNWFSSNQRSCAKKWLFNGDERKEKERGESKQRCL